MTIELVVVINGFPGVGKLTVAQHLCKLIPDAKVFDNHLLIDVAARLYEREDEAYLPLRKALRSTIFQSLSLSMSKNPQTLPRMLIFTECQSDNELGKEVMSEYLAFAQHLSESNNTEFLSIILDCSTETNAQRLVERDVVNDKKEGTTMTTTTKLVDVDVLKELRSRAVIHRYRLREQVEEGYEWEIDSTGFMPLEVAKNIAGRLDRLGAC